MAKSSGKKLCAKGKAAAKAKFKVYPSAYANGYAVQVCKGSKPGLDGKKIKSYKKGGKTGLDKWFDEKWVDVSTKVNGKHPPCGRKSAKGGSTRSYPACRPQAVASKMSASEKRQASSKKKSAGAGPGGRPSAIRWKTTPSGKRRK